MKGIVPSLLTTVLLLVGSEAVGAQTIAVTTPLVGPITVSSATAGSQPAPITGISGGNYTIVQANGDGKLRITGRLSTAMPAGTTLTVALSAPSGVGTALGAVALTATPQALVISIPRATATRLATATFRLVPKRRRVRIVSGDGIDDAAGRAR